MEMHVYKLMEKQYGLRSLAIDNTATLVNSLDILSDEDNDIAVFKCVFGNIIGEDFVTSIFYFNDNNGQTTFESGGYVKSGKAQSCRSG